MLAPFVFIISLALVRSATWHDLYRSLFIVLILIIFGFFLLLPLLLLYWALFKALQYRAVQPQVKKVLLSVVGMMAIWLLYYFYDRGFFAEGGFAVYSWPLSYSFVLMVAGAFLKMPGKEVLPEAQKKKKK